MKAGAANGERGYQLTFGIALHPRSHVRALGDRGELRDERPVESGARALRPGAPARPAREHEATPAPCLASRSSSAVSPRSAPRGCASYFYLGFYAKGRPTTPCAITPRWSTPRGRRSSLPEGRLSHHHGIGKIRQDFVKDIYSDGARAFMRQVKQAVDPDNLFGVANHGVLGEVALSSAEEQGRAPSP